ncbi:MAG: AsnC family transcriptional regulator [Candidatus Omnitrophica bacterium CG1_02_44_16]|nr:MAG: AsnC family transcriptional regulator [Candidatus Omnitrophica bacterium CG1_02_44_16]PIY83961.1 MAG: AsnC family transcriptional regulator [Candidatus Omnitrophica bacterium CG_4_10_14_0_8_um_filter_44_12]PIZ84162.1 MAG: AsnC family transcriptional regulator [Candidatus Omnitrophica bacterium CG_4_10_14_0_2_um_filter_44_9]
MDAILELLAKDARITPLEISKLTKIKVEEVKKRIRKYEKDGIILGYKTVINREMVEDKEREVRALIEVKVMPQKDLGFDKVAERIYSFPEVTNCYLLSGSYDLLLVVEGKDLKTVSRFVAEKLSPMEHVRGTVTHFLLKKYKQDSTILKCREEDKRLAISY